MSLPNNGSLPNSVLPFSEYVGSRHEYYQVNNKKSYRKILIFYFLNIIIYSIDQRPEIALNSNLLTDQIDNKSL